MEEDFVAQKPEPMYKWKQSIQSACYKLHPDFAQATVSASVVDETFLLPLPLVHISCYAESPRPSTATQSEDEDLAGEVNQA